MPTAHQPRGVWLGIGIALAGLLAMGSLALGPGRAATGRATAPTRALIPAMATFAPTATRPPTATTTAAATPTVTATPTPMPTATPTAFTAPVLAPDGQVRTARVPILMYHYVGGLPAGADPYRIDLTVSPEMFEAQLAYLQAAGYSSISLEDLARHLAAGAPLPPKPIILTFDDGYVDNFIYAFPLLRQYGFAGTFFVVTQFLDEGRAGYVSWEQVRLMQNNGMDIQAHGVSHEDPKKQPVALLQQEIAGSQQAIEAHLNKPVRFFAYPFGHYDSRVVGVLRSAGYWGAVTTRAGVAHSSQGLFELSRVRTHGTYGLDRFRDTLDYYLP